MKNQNGMTVMELLIAVMLTAILAIGTMGMFDSFTRGNVALKKGVELQEGFSRANQILERDIRMAGYNLPGNGLRLSIASENSKMIQIFQNRKSKKTALAAFALTNDSTLLINDDFNDLSHSWICLHVKDSNVTHYYPVAFIGHNTIGVDTVKLALAHLTRSWDTANTEVFFPECITFGIENTSHGRTFVRRFKNKTYFISSDFDTVKVVPKDLNGNLLAANYENTRTITIYLKKKMKTVTGQDQLVSNRVEINIRNYN